MARPKLTRPMQAAVIVALLVAVVLIWIGAPREQRVASPVTVDSVTTEVAAEPDTVIKPRKRVAKLKKKALAPPRQRDYLDEKIN